MHTHNDSSLLAPSESPSSKPEQPTHICEYYNSLKKANKALNRKNKQIDTLNRIIRNLKTDIAELNAGREKGALEVRQAREEVERVRGMLAEVQMRELEGKRQACEERLESAMRATRQPSRGSQLMREHSNDYFSQCHISRNTQDDRDRYILEPETRSNKPEPSYKHIQKQREGSLNLNMGEMFMGRKMRLDMNEKLNRHASWGQFQMLMKPKLSNGSGSGNGFEKEYSFRGGPPYGSNVNYQSAISFIKRQTQALKSPIF